MRRLKALLRRRSFDEGNSASTNADRRRIAPLDTRRSLDSRRNEGDFGDSHRSSDTGRLERARNSVDHNTASLDRSKPSGYRQPAKIRRKVNEQPEPADSPLETINEGHNMSRKHVRTGTDNPSSSTKAITEKQLEISPMRIVNNQRNNSTSTSKEDNGKAIAPKVYDDESHDTEEVYEDCVETHSSHGAFPDLTNTVDTDEVTTHAPAVTHETIRPHIHEIIEEQIYRDIHTHEVFHRIQPVYDVEFLPARHFVPGSDGGLVEVSEDDLPDCTGSNQKWRLDKRAPLYSVPSLSSDSPGRPGPALEQSVNSRPIDSELPDRLEKLQLETTDPETGIKSRVIHPDPLRSEPVNLKPVGPEDLQPMETRGTNNTGSDFGDLVEESWQSSAPRIF